MMPLDDGQPDVPSRLLMTPDLSRAYTRFDRWMLHQALPFWSTVGHDGPGRPFTEHLTLDAKPADVPFRRVRVQARQIYVFSHAEILGWPHGRRTADDAYRFLISHGRLGDGWVRRIGRDGGVIDAAADLYDIAFVLFALAWRHRATGDAEPIALARRTVAWLDGLRIAGQPGFENVKPVEAGPRQQNPHMHLLEAALALFEASGDEVFRDLALELVALFQTKLFDAANGTLAEFFADDWQRRRPAAIEPGHQFEWAWLLHQAGRLLGIEVAAEGRRLYEFAARHGGMPVVDAVTEQGAIRDASTRLWPQTEAIKAHLVFGDMPAAARLTGTLCTRFLAPAGTWIDHFGADGRALPDKIPASSLYHLFMAYAELHRVSAG